jgi:PBP1b-binding outer membrane lipoprotein LpoB
MEHMKILISIIMALFLLGCSDYGTDKAQQSKPQEAVGEMPDEAPSRYEETQEQKTLDIPLAEDSNYTDEDAADETMMGD